MEFEEFLKEASTLIGLQWRPFLKKGIKRKLERRIKEIGLKNFKDYFIKIKEELYERENISKILKITVSRFFRDREVFDRIETSLIPILIENYKRETINIWSIGCASGEEPYSIALIWRNSVQKMWPTAKLSILATDIDENLINRAIEAKYQWSSLKEIPEEILKKYFKKENGFYLLDPSVREGITFRRHNIIRDELYKDMDIILCRNLAFTYFSKTCQIEILKKIGASLNSKGYLIIGKDETLPLTYPTLFCSAFPKEKIYKKNSSSYHL
jgi:chemotaxis methyl-accepting protein methylase